MNDEKEIIYIDSNIFLNPILYNIEINEEAKRAEIFLNKLAKREISGITSILTWDELVWIIRKNIGKEDAIKKGKEFLVFPNLVFKKVSLSIINRAQDLFSKYNIGPRDAVHTACALENNAEIICSFDSGFDKIKEIKRIEPS